MHGFPYHLYKVAPQCLQICLVTELRGERFEGLSSIILPPVEAPVYERLDATPQWVEQRGYNQRGDNYGELRLLLLFGEGAEDGLQTHHHPEVHYYQHRSEGSVDESAVYDHVDLVEPVAEDCDPDRCREHHQAQSEEYPPDVAAKPIRTGYPAYITADEHYDEHGAGI